MKKKFLFFLSVLLVINIRITAQNCGVSAVYGGGPFYNNASVTIPEIKASGFNTVIVWTIHIDSKGNLNFNAEFPIVANGNYIGTSKYPAFSKNMSLLKTQPTSVTRIEFGLSASGSSTFSNIKTLINAEGTGSNSMLYKNFKALKDSVPALDALNFDDESTYDIATSVKFAVMLNDLGFKVALCPYTNSNYWTNVASQTNNQRTGCVDKIFLQCYDGGASNNPCSWNFNGIPVYPGLWDTKDSPSSVQTKMSNWKNQCGISGGFMWLYDDFKGTSSTKQYATAINNAFAIGIPGNASYTQPGNASVNVSLNPTLKWTSDKCAQSHDVYFGTNNPPAFIQNQTTDSYLTPLLNANTTYYWRIDEKNFFGKTTGTVWSFTTQGPTGTNTQPGTTDSPSISCFPNPFTFETTLKIQSNTPITATISIYNCLGEQLAILADKKTIHGQESFLWNGKDQEGKNIPQGLYVIHMTYINVSGAVINRTMKLLYQK